MCARRKLADWELDKTFVDVAIVCWPEDFKRAASSPTGSWGKEYSQRQTARKGWKALEILEEQVERMAASVEAMSQRIEGLRKRNTENENQDHS